MTDTNAPVLSPPCWICGSPKWHAIACPRREQSDQGTDANATPPDLDAIEKGWRPYAILTGPENTAGREILRLVAYCRSLSERVEKEKDRAILNLEWFRYEAKSHEFALARIKTLEVVVDRAARQFELYELSHRAKETDDGNAKADTNARMAQMCRAALGTKQDDPHE